MPVCEPGRFITARKTGSSGPGRSQLAFPETTSEEETGTGARMEMVFVLPFGLRFLWTDY